VLAAALAIADEAGLEQLSFRRLASRLGVTPMALYRHVEDKDALLEGIGDLALARLELTAPTGDWREQPRATARSFRALALAHPAAVRLFVSRPLFTPAAQRTADAVLGLLRRAGFPPERAVLHYRQLVRFLLALAVLEAERRDAVADPRGAGRAALSPLLAEQLPYLAEAAPYLAPGEDAEAAFEAGLDFLIAGFERLLAVGAARS
jgi:AcrR family transcriptional regulator